MRRRDEAARELRRLGHGVLRAARAADGDPLTAREREIAEHVATGRTTPTSSPARRAAGSLDLPRAGVTA